MDTRPRWLWAGSQEELSLGRPLAGPEDVAVCVEGARSAAAPSTGVQGRCWARRGAGVPSQARGRSSGCGCAQWKAGCFPASVGLWEGGVFAGHLPASLLFGRSRLPRPGLHPPLSRLGIGPSVGSCWNPPPSVPSLCCHCWHPPPARPLALPGGTDAPSWRVHTPSLPPELGVQPPGALRRPLRF